MNYGRRSRFAGKFLALFAVPVVFLAASGCELKISFSATEAVAQQTIDGNPGGGLLPAQMFTTTLSVTNTQDYTSQQVEKLRAVKITELTLTIDAASNNIANDPLENGNADDWSFVTSVSVSVRATIDGEVRTEVVASIPSGSAQFNAGSTTLTFDCSEVDLLPFVLAPNGYEVIASATGNIPPDDVIFSGTAKYKVTANLLNQ